MSTKIKHKAATTEKSILLKFCPDIPYYIGKCTIYFFRSNAFLTLRKCRFKHDHPKSPFCLGKYAPILPTNFTTTTVSNRSKTLKILFSVIQRIGYVTYRKSELLLGIEIIVILEHTILLHLRYPLNKTDFHHGIKLQIDHASTSWLFNKQAFN